MIPEKKVTMKSSLHTEAMRLSALTRKDRAGFCFQFKRIWREIQRLKLRTRPDPRTRVTEDLIVRKNYRTNSKSVLKEWYIRLTFIFQLKSSSSGTAGHLLDTNFSVAGNNTNSWSTLVFFIYHSLSRHFWNTWKMSTSHWKAVQTRLKLLCKWSFSIHEEYSAV